MQKRAVFLLITFTRTIHFQKHYRMCTSTSQKNYWISAATQANGQWQVLSTIPMLTLPSWICLVTLKLQKQKLKREDLAIGFPFIPITSSTNRGHFQPVLMPSG